MLLPAARCGYAAQPLAYLFQLKDFSSRYARWKIKNPLQAGYSIQSQGNSIYSRSYIKFQRMGITIHYMVSHYKALLAFVKQFLKLILFPLLSAFLQIENFPPGAKNRSSVIIIRTLPQALISRHLSTQSKAMIKSLASLVIAGAIFCIQGHSSAQEAFGAEIGAGHVSAGTYPETDYHSPFVPSFSSAPNSGPTPYPSSSVYSGIQDSSGTGFGSSRSLPRMLLPLPVNSPIWGFQTRYGFQYPGSYLPAGTPLHQYNGYIVCDPPPAAAGKRVIKTTTTRSLAAPGNTPPCPVYTINGEIPEGKSYTTKSAPRAHQNPPP